MPLVERISNSQAASCGAFWIGCTITAQKAKQNPLDTPWSWNRLFSHVPSLVHSRPLSTMIPCQSLRKKLLPIA